MTKEKKQKNPDKLGLGGCLHLKVRMSLRRAYRQLYLAI